MQIIVFPKPESDVTEDAVALVEYSLCGCVQSPVVRRTIAEPFHGNNGSGNPTKFFIPSQWNVASDGSWPDVSGYEQDLVASCLPGSTQDTKWILLTNGRYYSPMEPEWIWDHIEYAEKDIALVNMNPALAAYREKICFTHTLDIVGFRRHYADTIYPAPIPDRFPHHIFIRKEAAETMIQDGGIPLGYSAFLDQVQKHNLTVVGLEAGGHWHDLYEAKVALRCMNELIRREGGRIYKGAQVHRKAQLIGPVWIGPGAQIEEGAVIVGPACIDRDTVIHSGSVIRNSIIGPNLEITAHRFADRCSVLTQSDSDLLPDLQTRQNISTPPMHSLQQNWRGQVFRNWPLFSYPRFWKRLFDILIASLVLLLFAPIFIVVAAAIKISSPGPVFYGARRQGLRGKEFRCLKFRSMIVQAEQIQEKLRIVNQVDGPQFKMDHDPRVNAIGRFLRDTSIDEIPQFINVLKGQMSVVGPRPSPEEENETCPPWRDARLSVRPGITGLWQICRTREESRDFQEWIHYDTEYVRNISLRQDLWICWQTALKLINDFVDQF